MSDSEAGSRLHPVTRRFADPELEREYQLEAGREARDQMGLGQLLGGIPWLSGGLILPQISPVDVTLVPIVVVALWVVTGKGLMRTSMVIRPTSTDHESDPIPAVAPVHTAPVGMPSTGAVVRPSRS